MSTDTVLVLSTDGMLKSININQTHTADGCTSKSILFGKYVNLYIQVKVGNRQRWKCETWLIF